LIASPDLLGKPPPAAPRLLPSFPNLQQHHHLNPSKSGQHVKYNLAYQLKVRDMIAEDSFECFIIFNPLVLIALDAKRVFGFDRVDRVRFLIEQLQGQLYAFNS
jgi:hypothetical protein